MKFNTSPKRILLGRYLRFCRHLSGYSLNEVAQVFYPDCCWHDVLSWELGNLPDLEVLDVLQSLYGIDRIRFLKMIAGVRTESKQELGRLKANQVIGLSITYFRLRAGIEVECLSLELQKKGFQIDQTFLKSYEAGRREAPLFILGAIIQITGGDPVATHCLNTLMEKLSRTRDEYEPWLDRVINIMTQKVLRHQQDIRHNAHSSFSEFS